MVSYLNAHDALEQRRRAAKEAGTSGRAGPRTIVSALARLFTCAKPLASILCGWRSRERASALCAQRCRYDFLIEVAPSKQGFYRTDLVTGKQIRQCHARYSWALSFATTCLSWMEL